MPVLKEELEVYWDGMGNEEREILIEVAHALYQGQKIYGPFDLMTSELDFMEEADAEDRDWLVYRAAAILQDRKRRGRTIQGGVSDRTDQV